MKAFFRLLLIAPNGSICNVGNDEEISIIHVAETIKKILDNEIKISLKESTDPNYVVDNPQRRCPDLKLIEKLTGYRPSIKFERGISRLSRWYMDNRS